MWYKTTTCILLCITSLVLSTTVNAQEHDSLNYKKKYGLRLGVNLASALRTAAETGFSGWELQSDIRIADRFFVAAEIGNQTRLWLDIMSNGADRGISFQRVFDGLTCFDGIVTEL